MMMSQILKSVDFTRTQKSTYIESKVLFFLQIKKFLNCASRTTIWQKRSVNAKMLKILTSPLRS